MGATDTSVTNYSTPDSLIQALRTTNENGQLDWVLQNFDESTTITQTEIDEFKRLSVLQSYEILDTPKEIDFDSITQEAKEYFGVPIAVVSLVDKGRQWFKSIQGLDAQETPRSCAFCAHVVQRKDGPSSPVLVVPDATKDHRFQNNPLVVGGPEIRFYAGAPLLSPEGPKLGTICIIDTRPHPEGLTDQQKQRLQAFASEAVYYMIARLL